MDGEQNTFREVESIHRDPKAIFMRQWDADRVLSLGYLAQQNQDAEVQELGRNLSKKYSADKSETGYEQLITDISRITGFVPQELLRISQLEKEIGPLSIRSLVDCIPVARETKDFAQRAEKAAEVQRRMALGDEQYQTYENRMKKIASTLRFGEINPKTIGGSLKAIVSLTPRHLTKQEQFQFTLPTVPYVQETGVYQVTTKVENITQVIIEKIGGNVETYDSSDEVFDKAIPQDSREKMELKPEKLQGDFGQSKTAQEILKIAINSGPAPLNLVLYDVSGITDYKGPDIQNLADTIYKLTNSGYLKFSLIRKNGDRDEMFVDIGPKITEIASTD